MSREQRRMDRKQPPATASSTPPPPPSRRTPVKAPGGGGPPWAAVGVIGGTVTLVLLIAYLIFQARSDDGTDLSKPEREEANMSTDLPGTYVPSQGRGHFSFAFSPARTPTAFCEGVPHSGEDAQPAGTAEATAPATTTTPAATSTGIASTSTSGTPAGTTAAGTAEATPTVPTNCYNSNPPATGRHLNSQRNADVGNGAKINIPPDPDVYPTDVVIPREAIPHILEHAGVFVGYNCAEGNSDCEAVVQELTDLVNDRIDNHDDRVVMARDPDLPVGTIGLSAWTRFMRFPSGDYDEGEVEDFIGTHSCRIDWENFCR